MHDDDRTDDRTDEQTQQSGQPADATSPRPADEQHPPPGHDEERNAPTTQGDRTAALNSPDGGDAADGDTNRAANTD